MARGLLGQEEEERGFTARGGILAWPGEKDKKEQEQEKEQESKEQKEQKEH